MLDQIQKNHPPLYRMNTEILVSEEISFCSDYRSDINFFGPKYVLFRIYEQNKMCLPLYPKFTQYPMGHRYAHMRLVIYCIEPFRSNFLESDFWTMMGLNAEKNVGVHMQLYWYSNKIF